MKRVTVVDEGKLLATLARIIYSPQQEIEKDVKAARERIEKIGVFHYPPQTDDENLVSLYEAVVGPER